MIDSAKPYDVFFSYNSQDSSAVQAIARTAQQRGLTVYLDRWYLVPGRPWYEGLEQALSACRAVAVFLGPSGMGRWQQPEAYLSLERQTRTPDFGVVPVLLPGADPALGFLSLNTWVDLRSGLEDPVSVGLLEAAVRGLPPGPDLRERVATTMATICPYRGLRPFREEDAPVFFGREPFTDLLANAVEQHSLVAVVGASGSGKSSVVRAGLVPRLRRNHGRVWDILTLLPGDRPFHSLAAALLPLLEPEMDEVARLVKIQELASFLAEGRLALRDVVARVLEKQRGTDRLLLVADQWEEIYTLCRDEPTRHRFIDELLAATAAGPLTMVLTLRGDFFGHALGYRPLVDRIQQATITLGPMSREELERAVEAPAKTVALEFERGLVERILDDVEREPGSLPLLEFALTELWERRSGTRLLHETYEAMGEVGGAIASRADDVYNQLGPNDQESLRRTMIQLVQPGQGTEDTRRRALFRELGEAARPIVRSLADARLVVTGRDEATSDEYAEVAHEALIRRWDRARDWMNADRVFRAWQERLRGTVRQWEASGRHDDALLRGPLLAEAEGWLDRRKTDLGDDEREFIQAGVARRKREHETRERRRRKTLQIVCTVAIAMFLLAGLASWAAWSAGRQANRAGKAEAVARARLLTIQGRTVSEDQPLLGLRLALEGLALAPPEDSPSRTSITQSIAEIAQRGRLMNLGTDFDAVYPSPDGARWIVRHADGSTEYRSAERKTIARLRGIEAEPRGKVPVVFSPDPSGTYFFLDYEGRSSELRRGIDGHLIAEIIKPDPPRFRAEQSQHVEFSPDTAVTYMTWSHYETYKLIRCADGALPLERVSGVAFSRRGDYMAVTYAGGTWELRRLPGAAAVPGVTSRDTGVSGRVRFSPDVAATYLLISQTDNPFYPQGMILRRNGGKVVPIKDKFHFVMFPDSAASYYVVKYGNTTAASGEIRRSSDDEVIAGLSNVYWVEFSPDSAVTYCAVIRDHLPWELRRCADGTTVPLDGKLRGVHFSPTGTFLVADYSDRPAELRSIPDGSLVASLTGKLRGVHFSPTGTFLVADYSDRPVELRSIPDGSLVASLTGKLAGCISARPGRSLSPTTPTGPRS